MYSPVNFDIYIHSCNHHLDQKSFLFYGIWVIKHAKKKSLNVAFTSANIWEYSLILSWLDSMRKSPSWHLQIYTLSLVSFAFYFTSIDFNLNHSQENYILHLTFLVVTLLTAVDFCTASIPGWIHFVPSAFTITCWHICLERSLTLFIWKSWVWEEIHWLFVLLEIWPMTLQLFWN